MRIEHLDLPDDLATAAAELFADATWAELIEYALALVIADARAADTDADEQPPAEQPGELTAEELVEQTIAAALGWQTT